MRSSRSFTSYFGATYGGTGAVTNSLSGFVAGGKTYDRVPGPADKPFTKVNIQRKNNPAYTGNRFSAFFEYSSVRNASGQERYNVRDLNGLELYIKPAAVYTMQDALNNFSLSYGTDNLFSNQGTGNAGSQGPSGAESGNNIERIDMIYQPGLQATTVENLAAIGVLINERGGNDAFKVAAITALDGNGDVSALGPIISISSSAWGTAAGPEISTVVFMGAEGSGR